MYAGLRPLLAGESESTSKLSREHAVAVPAPGLVAIAGGKYTTYRVMGEDAIDAASEYVPTRVAPSITEKVPLMGADGYFALINQTEHVGSLYGLHPYRVRHLLDRYGSLIGDVLAMAEDKPELLTPITEAPVYLKVEAFYAAAAEGALHLEDILARRMRISIEYPHRGVRLRPRGRRGRRTRAWLERRGHRPRGQHLHRPCRRRSPEPAAARRRVRRCAAGRGPRGACRDPRAGSAHLRRVPPLPVRDGLGPARVRLRGGAVLVELANRFGEAAAAKVLAGEVVCADGAAVTAATVLPPEAHVYLYRDLPDEVPVPFDIPVLHRDDDIVVVDKPHFLATMPRGGHVAQTATVRLRRELDLPELSPAHRLDRLTAGVLLFTARREVRGAYQTLFARGEVRKVYLARAAVDPELEFPMTVRSRIIKERGRLQAFEEPGEPNAETFIEHLGDGLYRLTPRTGRTHQLRVHMASLGLPIIGDSLYPNVVDVARDDFSTPLGCWRRASSSTIRSADVCVALSAGAVSTHDGCDGWQVVAVPGQVDAGR